MTTIRHVRRDMAFISVPGALKYVMKNNKDAPTAPFQNDDPQTFDYSTHLKDLA